MEADRKPSHGKRLQTPQGGRGGQNPTLRDIAEAAGVSTATVSRVLNSPDAVRPALRERVSRTIAELGYVPHGAARALASQRSRTIGAIIPTLDNAIFAAGIEAFERRLDQDGYTLFVALSDYDPQHELRHMRGLLGRGVDGMLLVGGLHEAASYDLIRRQGRPYVNTWVHDPRGGHPCIGFDNRSASRRAAEHLLDLGHRRIAMIAGVLAFNDRARERVAGVRDALAARGLDLADADLVERRYDIAEARQAMGQLLEGPRPPSAVVCGNDVQAIGALLECQARGVAVPGQVSIIGFDDLPLTAHLAPALTTMHVPSRDMGRRAAEYLLDRLAGRPAAPALELAVDLVVRGTTGPAPKGV
ncbi:MAG: LacI family DNA-binding transcriptional regulator [Rhodobacterales bacterium]|nr:LacI family DNA-binding transcriptional regulator [Rhodobacterales bacterium]